jgi:hypothetical protein
MRQPPRSLRLGPPDPMRPSRPPLRLGLPDPMRPSRPRLRLGLPVPMRPSRPRLRLGLLIGEASARGDRRDASGRASSSGLSTHPVARAEIISGRAAARKTRPSMRLPDSRLGLESYCGPSDTIEADSVHVRVIRLSTSNTRVLQAGSEVRMERLSNMGPIQCPRVRLFAGLSPQQNPTRGHSRWPLKHGPWVPTMSFLTAFDPSEAESFGPIDPTRWRT